MKNNIWVDAIPMVLGLMTFIVYISQTNMRITRLEKSIQQLEERKSKNT